MKKKIIILVAIVIVAAAIVAVAVFANPKPTMTGRAIVSGSSILIIGENEEPVVLHPKTEKVFQNVTLHTGDLIRITHDGYFLASFPAQTTIDKVQVLEQGSIADIPEKTIEMLPGWPID